MIKFLKSKILRTYDILKKEGIFIFLQKLLKTFQKLLNNYKYRRWIINKENILFTQKTFLPYQPMISIILPTYNPHLHFLKEAVNSVRTQTYSNWELCIVDDGSTVKEHFLYLKNLKDSRIKLQFLQKNKGISVATNIAFKMTTGIFIALLDHDDCLSPHALYEVIFVLNKHKFLDLIYSDEDKITSKGKRFSPNFKPDWSPDFLLSTMYINHLSVYRKSIIQKAGLFRKKYDFAQDYDLALRVTEFTNKIYHIPLVLYHWRVHSDSSSFLFDKHSIHTLRGKMAVQDALLRRDIQGSIIIKNPGEYSLRVNKSRKQ